MDTMKTAADHPSGGPAAGRGPAQYAGYGLAAAVLAVLLAAFVRHLVVTLPFPYPVEYGEGVMAGWLQRFYGGQPLYPPLPPDGMPWLHNPYGPLWFLVAVPLRAAGVGALTAARLVSLLGFAACCGLLYRLARRDLTPAGAVCVAALFGASPLAWRYAVMGRVDMPALAFSLGALALMERGERGGRAAPWMWLLAGSAAGAAILIKPLYAAAALAGLAAGIRRERRRCGVRLASGLLLVLLAAAAGLAAAGERSVVEHWGWMNRIGSSLPLLLRVALDGAARHPLIVLALLCGLSRVRFDAPRWWFAVCMAASLLAAVKIGADAHYFLAPLLAGVVMIGPLCAGQGARGVRWLGWCLAAQLALYLPIAPRPVFTATYGQEIPAGHSALTPGESDAHIGRLLVEEIAGADGPVLADDPGYVVAAGGCLLFQPFQYGRLVHAGRVDPAPLERRIEAGWFHLIILRTGQPGGPAGSDVPAQVVDLIRDRYQLHREIGPYLLYVKPGGL